MACNLSFSSFRTRSFARKSNRAEEVSPATVSKAASLTAALRSTVVGLRAAPGSSTIPSLALSSLMSSILLSFPSNIVFCTALPLRRRCRSSSAIPSLSAFSSNSGMVGVAGLSRRFFGLGRFAVNVAAKAFAFATIDSPSLALSSVMVRSMSSKSLASARFFLSAAVLITVPLLFGLTILVLRSFAGIVLSIAARVSRLLSGAVLLRTSYFSPPLSMAWPSLLMGA
mmetsp:Transcript_8650/g.17548  ORF Transcript_8650/g.17548 Transcript_8650/m.17548 type:complete len:227 (-) Transcript_8650:890-1570(-)